MFPLPRPRRAQVVWAALFTILALYVASSVGLIPNLFGVLRHGLYHGLMVVGSVAAVLRAARARTDRTAWLLIAGALVAWAAADLYWSLALADLPEPPYPSISDAGWIAFYPACYAGLLLLIRSRCGSVPRSATLDGVIAALGAGSLVTALVFPPILASAVEGTPAAVAVNLAYPVGDLLLLALLVGSLGFVGWRPDRALCLLGLGLVLTCVADISYLHAVASGGDGEGWTTAFWPASMLVTALAAGDRRDTRLATSRFDGLRLLVVPAIFTTTAFVVLVWDHFERVSHTAAVLAAATLAAVFVRTWMTFREHLRLLGVVREEAYTDALTGLGNRRALMHALDTRIPRCSPRERTLLALFDLNGFKDYNDVYGHPAGDALLGRLAHALSDALADTAGAAYRMGGDEFCVLVPLAEGSAEEAPVMAACLAALSDRGDGFAVSAAHGVFVIDDPATTPSDALREADRRMYAVKDSSRASAQGQSVEVLMRLLAERDGTLVDHLDETAHLCRAVANRLGLPDDACTTIERAAALHDVGKVAIPDAILNKPGPLNDEEWAFMRRHTVVGERILLGAPALREVARIVRASHERWDGAGYPDRVAGEEIPLGARVVAACDAFHAMTSDRPYRAAMSEQDALAELRRCAGTQFDPAVVEALCAAVEAPAAVR